MDIRNEDVEGLTVEIPEGHRHVRATVLLRDGTELSFREATVANLLRAFVTVKTHPLARRVKMRAARLESAKEGYDPWQLLEVADVEAKEEGARDEGL
jgi:hypothetical protein